ncbi:MAG: nitroreductase family protein [Dehalococcoidia bacterium]|nr:nitroreductase family protein [Dehalococcoidia bacterium]
MELMQAILERRSVRRFKSDPVSDELINTVLEAGRWAPSWANTQCWRFIVVRDDRVKDLISEAVHSANPASKAIRNAPVTIVICGELKKAGYYHGDVTTDKGDWFMFDTALATQNMALAAHSLGLGTVIVGLFDAQKVAQVMEVPSTAQVVALLPLGYPEGKPTGPSRKGLSDIVFHDRYGVG